jgi:SAM-dependent methyltransferase
VSTDWDAFFDSDYIRAYEPVLGDESTRAEAVGAMALAGVAPGAEVLDCPCGYGRHALVLAELGYRVTGVDISETQLGEARRRRGGDEMPALVAADYRDLPFADASFDCAVNLFTSLGYWGRDNDVRALAELRRVLRHDAPLIVETAHRDRLAARFRPSSWQELPGGALSLDENEFDLVEGVVHMRQVLVRGGASHTRRATHRMYSVTEFVEMAHAAGFERVEAFGDWEATKPPWLDTRLIMRCR